MSNDMIFIVMRLLSIPIALGKFEKPSMSTITAPFLRLLLVLQLLLLSYLVIGLDDGVSVCTFNSASSIADCSNRNTMLNQLPEAEKRLRYDPFPELFSGDAVDAFTRYRRHKKEISDIVESSDDQNVDKRKTRKRKGIRIQKLDQDDECMDISKYSTVIDFSCIYMWSSEVFHHTFECFMGNYDLFKAAQNHNHNSTIFIVPYEQTKKARLMPFVDFFLPKKTRQAAVVKHRYLKLGGHPREEARFGYQNHDCFVVNTQATVMYTNLKTLWLDYWAIDQVSPTHPGLVHMMKTAQRFQKDIQTTTKRLTLQKSTDRTILFIYRSETRVISNADAIVEAINDAVSSTQVHGQLRSTTFYGNETFTDTVLLFQQAAVVIAFHGAGLVNTIYCSSDAVIVELSIAAEPQSDRKPKDNEMPPMWRSNHVIGTLCQLHWITYLLRSTKALLRMDNEKSGFLFQLHLHTIMMLQTDITRLATIIKNKILAISSKSSISLSSSSPSSLYVARQITQGSFEVFTSENPHAITPMTIFGQSSHSSSNQSTSLKPRKKSQMQRRRKTFIEGGFQRVSSLFRGQSKN